MSCEGGVGCMWWPWGACGLPMGYVCAVREVWATWPWGACELLMGCVCAVRKVWAACGGHGGYGVHMDYLWPMYVL